MAAVSTEFAQAPAANAPEWPEAQRIASQLLAGLNEAEAASLILSANKELELPAWMLLPLDVEVAIQNAQGFAASRKGVFLDRPVE